MCAMDSYLYKAIQEGNVDGMKKLIIANHEQSSSGDHYLLQAVTISLRSSPVHIAVQFNQVECLEEIYKMCPSLLMKQNSEGDTPLHIASRLRLDDIVRTLIGWARNSADVAGGGGGLTKLQQLVRMKNKNNDTALHEALQYVGDSINLVLPLLIDADPGFDYFPNDAGETPLYLAVKNAKHSEIEYILDKFPCQAHGAPDGKTVLHIAMQLNDCIRSDDTVALLLKKKPHLVKEADKDGMTALHYAASLYRAAAFSNILDVDSSVGYLRDKDGMTALHYLTTDHFYVSLLALDTMHFFIQKMIGKLAERCPDCWEMRDNRGHNFLHTAAVCKKLGFFEAILMNMQSSPNNDLVAMNLLNQKDNNGKTPCDLFFTEGPDGYTPDLCPGIIKRGTRTRLYMYPRDNDFNVSPRNKAEGKITNDEQQQDLTGQANMVTATLLATIAFAAAITFPGGHTSEGTANLEGRTAFVIFTICNNLTMLLSCSSLLSYFYFSMLRDKFGASRFKTDTSLHNIPSYCTVLAIPTMMGAFVAGTYAVLSQSPGLAIPICILGGSFFPLWLILFCIAQGKANRATIIGNRIELPSLC